MLKKLICEMKIRILKHTYAHSNSEYGVIHYLTTIKRKFLRMVNRVNPFQTSIHLLRFTF